MLESPTAMSRARSNTPVPDKVDVAIVGAGIGGLTAGAYLARHGLRVAVFDGHYVAGGCCTQFGRGKGDDAYRFDIGLHYVGDCQPGGMIPEMLRKLDVDIDFLPMDPDGFDTLVFPDLEFRIPVGIDPYRDRLVETFPSERKGIDRYIKFLKQVELISGASERNRGKISPLMALQVLFKGRMVARYQNATMADVLESITDDPKLRAVILGQSGDYGLPPSEVSAMLHAGLALHYFKGAYYPRGGGQIIADRVASVIEDHGGSIHLRKPIERILIENGRAVGLRTEANRRGEFHELRADLVISNADISATMEHLVGPEHLPPALVEKTRGFTYAGAIFLTCLGVTADMKAKGMRSANYWQFDGYDVEAFYALSRKSGTPETYGCYITSATMKDPDTAGHAPEGITSIEVMTLVPGDASFWGVAPEDIGSWTYKRDDAYRALKQRLEQDMLRRLDGVFPGTSDTVVFCESATPVTHSRYTRAKGGTGYGIAATPEQFMNNRPGYRTPIQGLYLCGASTRAGHGVVGAMRSGQHAAYCIGRDLGRPLGGAA